MSTPIETLRDDLSALANAAVCGVASLAEISTFDACAKRLSSALDELAGLRESYAVMEAHWEWRIGEVARLETASLRSELAEARRRADGYRDASGDAHAALGRTCEELEETRSELAEVRRERDEWKSRAEHHRLERVKALDRAESLQAERDEWRATAERVEKHANEGVRLKAAADARLATIRGCVERWGLLRPLSAADADFLRGILSSEEPKP